MSIVSRGGVLTACLSATSAAIPSVARPIIPAVVQKAQKVLVNPPPLALTQTSFAKCLPKGIRLNPSATTSLSGFTTVRFLHHGDVQVPDFSYYRRSSVANSQSSSAESTMSRNAFTYLIVAAGTVPAVYASKAMVGQFISTMSMSADVLALAQIEINLADIPEGKNVTMKWRGKPLFVRHRTAEEIETEAAVDVASLRDPEHDSDRAKNPEWLVLLGVCTHLGCVPVSGTGEYGGYYCPCHGSHYDCSGRIRKGPAPLNLEVPQYDFPSEGTLVVG